MIISGDDHVSLAHDSTPHAYIEELTKMAKYSLLHECYFNHQSSQSIFAVRKLYPCAVVNHIFVRDDLKHVVKERLCQSICDAVSKYVVGVEVDVRLQHCESIIVEVNGEMKGPHIEYVLVLFYHQLLYELDKAILLTSPASTFPSQ